jgi:hypothetical protein
MGGLHNMSKLFAGNSFKDWLKTASKEQLTDIRRILKVDKQFLITRGNSWAGFTQYTVASDYFNRNNTDSINTIESLGINDVHYFNSDYSCERIA